MALSELAKLLHYNTIRAQVACKNANDHHKAWQMLEIFLYGTADELLVPFVRQCLTNNMIPSVEKFYALHERHGIYLRFLLDTIPGWNKEE